MSYPPSTLAADKDDSTTESSDHAPHHNALANAVNDIVTELGTNPSGAFVDTAARLTAIESGVSGGGIDIRTLGGQQITDLRGGTSGSYNSSTHTFSVSGGAYTFTSLDIGKWIVIKDLYGANLYGAIQISAIIGGSSVTCVDHSSGSSALTVASKGWLIGRDNTSFLNGSKLVTGMTFLVIGDGSTTGLLTSNRIEGPGKLLVVSSRSGGTTQPGPLFSQSAVDIAVRDVDFEWLDNYTAGSATTGILLNVASSNTSGGLDVRGCTFLMAPRGNPLVGSAGVNWGTISFRNCRYIPNGGGGQYMVGFIGANASATVKSVTICDNDFASAEVAGIATVWGTGTSRAVITGNAFAGSVPVGFTQTQFGTTWNPALLVANCNSVLIADNDMSSMVLGTFSTRLIVAILGSSGVRFHRNMLYPMINSGTGNRDCVVLEGCQDFEVIDNTMGSTTGGDFILCLTRNKSGYTGQSGPGVVRGNIIHGPLSGGNFVEAIVTDNSTQDVLIDGNFIDGYFNYSIECKTDSHDIAVVNNKLRIRNDTGAGVTISDATTEGCYIDGNHCVFDPNNGNSNGYPIAIIASAIGTRVGKNSTRGAVRRTTGTLHTTTTVDDTTAVAADIGRKVAGTGIVSGSTVAAVTPGVGFTLSVAATTSGAQALTLTADALTALLDSGVGTVIL